MNTADIAILIRNKRKEKGLKQKELADLLHVSAAAVNKWENGKNFPDLGNMQTLSKLLEIPMSELLGDFSQSSSSESDTNNITPEPDSQSSSPPEDLSSPEQSPSEDLSPSEQSPPEDLSPPEQSLPKDFSPPQQSPPEDLFLLEQSPPELPENPAPQSGDTPEPSDTAILDIEDAVFLETPILPVSQPEDVSQPPPSIRKWMRLKIAVPLLTFLLAGIVAVCWIAGGLKNKTPSYTVCDTYYGDYNGENVYYVITEVESNPTGEDLVNFNQLIRKQFEQHFSAVNKIVVIYAQDYTDYIENGFDDNTDGKGIILPIPK